MTSRATQGLVLTYNGGLNPPPSMAGAGFMKDLKKGAKIVKTGAKVVKIGAKIADDLGVPQAGKISKLAGDVAKVSGAVAGSGKRRAPKKGGKKRVAKRK